MLWSPRRTAPKTPHPTRRPRGRSSFRPLVECLEDRSLPSATHFLLVAPEHAPAGLPTPVTVVALDDANHPARDYTGSVHFTSTDAAAKLPADYTFRSRDHGYHSFLLTFNTTGPESVTATDTTTASLTGSVTVTVDAAPVATHFLVTAPPHVTAGDAVPVTVTALDAANHPVPNYTGTVHFTSTDPAADLPADYTFQARDHGTHLFPATFTTTGPQTLTATDTATATLTGGVTVTADAAPAANHFLLVAPPHTAAGVPTPVYLIALDAANHRVPNYTGTVHFTSTDPAAKLPADVTVQPGDHGDHLLLVTYNTPGKQTLTAGDTANASLTGSVTVTVDAAPVATHLLVFPVPPNTVGTASLFYVAALDAANHAVPNYTGTVHFTSTDPAAKLPADYKFQPTDPGVHAFEVTWQTAGKQTLTATDTVTPTINGSANVNVRGPVVATHFLVVAPPRAAAGLAVPVYVAALDDAHHLATNYTGTAHFTSSDPAAQLPADYTFQADDHGVHRFLVTFNTSDKQTVTATDVTVATLTGSATVKVGSLKGFLPFDLSQLDEYFASLLNGGIS